MAEIDQQKFVFSSYTGLPEKWFLGYCFLGQDFIAGTSEYAVPSGEDGCYVSVRRDDDQHIIGADHKGYRKLFYYSENGAWAISNSVMLLAEHIAKHGHNLTVNRASFDALGVSATFCRQLASYRTPISEIRLLPSSKEIVIRNNALTTRHIAPTSQPDTYEEALSLYLETWIGRISTLLSSDLYTTCDLTGGIDSRCTAALVLAARKAGTPKHFSFASGTAPQQAKDLEIARQICSVYGMPINMSNSRAERISAQESYDQWRSLCLGSYAPVYLGVNAWNPYRVSIGGGGGESHRSFYQLKQPATFLRPMRGEFSTEEVYRDWKEDVLATMHTLQERDREIHPLILHYREFRDRIHAGRAPQQSIVISPLGSKLLERCSALCPPHLMHSHQIAYDIMYNAAHELLDIPFDEDKKEPSSENKISITKIDLSSPNTGSSYILSSRQATEKVNWGSPLSVFCERFNDNLSAALDSGLIHSSRIASARELVAKALQTGRFDHPIRGGPPAHVILAAEIAALTA